MVLTTLKQRPGRLTPAGSDPKLSLRKQVSEVRKGLCDDAADSASAAARAAAEGGESVAGASLR